MWQPCLVIDGLAKPGHKEGPDNSNNVKQVIEIRRECGIRQDVIKNNLDKTNPIGWPDEHRKQLRIVKFTTDSFKEMVFR